MEKIYLDDSDYFDRILTVCEGNAEKAIQLNKIYRDILKNIPDYQKCLNQKSYQPWIDTLSNFIKHTKTLPLQYHGLDSNGRLILSFHLQYLNPRIDSVATSVFLLSIAFMEYLHEIEPKLKHNGIIMIADNKGIGFSHMRVLVSEFQIAKLFIKYLTEAASFRTRKVLVYKEVPVTRSIYGLVKGFLSQDVQKMIKFCGNQKQVISQNLGGQQFLPNFLKEKHNKTKVMHPERDTLIKSLLKALPKFE